MAQASLKCRMMAPKMLQYAPRTLHLARGRAPARDRSAGARTYEGGLGTRARILQRYGAMDASRANFGSVHPHSQPLLVQDSG
eukprot:1188470-Pyramimonas_sp.AAC.2